MCRSESSTCLPPATLTVIMRLLVGKHNKPDKIHADQWADKGSFHLKAPVHQRVCAWERERDLYVSEGLSDWLKLHEIEFKVEYDLFLELSLSRSV